jgi:DNA-binding transcriptional LysR family regulator
MTDLSGHALIGYADRAATWTYHAADGAPVSIEIMPAHAVSDSAALLPMLVGGAGIGRLPAFLARPAVDSGALVRLFAHSRGDAFDVHALYTSHRSLSAKVRVFIDALIEHLDSLSLTES